MAVALQHSARRRRRRSAPGAAPAARSPRPASAARPAARPASCCNASCYWRRPGYHKGASAWARGLQMRAGCREGSQEQQRVSGEWCGELVCQCVLCCVPRCCCGRLCTRANLAAGVVCNRRGLPLPHLLLGGAVGATAQRFDAAEFNRHRRPAGRVPCGPNLGAGRRRRGHHHPAAQVAPAWRPVARAQVAAAQPAYISCAAACLRSAKFFDPLTRRRRSTTPLSAS